MRSAPWFQTTISPKSAGRQAPHGDQHRKRVDQRLQERAVLPVCDFFQLAGGNVPRDDRDSIGRGDDLLADPARVDFREVELAFFVEAVAPDSATFTYRLYKLPPR